MIAALVGLAALVLAAGTCLGQGPASGSPADVLPINQDARIKAVDNMMENRRKTIAALLDVVKESQNADRSGPVAIWPSFGDGDRCCHAIRMLGDLRAQEAVDPIINIPFDTAGRVGDRKGWQRRMFPAAPASGLVYTPATGMLSASRPGRWFRLRPKPAGHRSAVSPLARPILRWGAPSYSPRSRAGSGTTVYRGSSVVLAVPGSTWPRSHRGPVPACWPSGRQWRAVPSGRTLPHKPLATRARGGCHPTLVRGECLPREPGYANRVCA